MMEKTLVILKPCTLQRGLVGEIINRFERKGLRLAGMKMVQLTDEVLSEHYAHLSSKPFFQRVKDAMMVCPVIVCCFEGVDAVQVVRTLTGPTNGRLAAPGTIRGDYSMSFQENIVHASDSPETAEVELKRFFKPEEILGSDISEQGRKRVQDMYGICVTGDNREVASKAEVLLLSVKPAVLCRDDSGNKRCYHKRADRDHDRAGKDTGLAAGTIWKRGKDRPYNAKYARHGGRRNDGCLPE